MREPTSTCTAPLCGYSLPGEFAHCPDCGRPMMSSRSVRRRGLFMLASGTFLFSLASAVTYMLAPMMSSDSFAGTPEQARTVIQLLWLLIILGACGAAAGAWQFATARRNRFATTGMLALAGLVVFAARVTDLTLSTPGA